MIGIKANQIYIYHFYARFFLMNIFFHNGINCAALGPSAYHMDIAETRWTDTGRIVKDDYTMIYSGGEDHKN